MPDGLVAIIARSSRSLRMRLLERRVVFTTPLDPQLLLFDVAGDLVSSSSLTADASKPSTATSATATTGNTRRSSSASASSALESGVLGGVSSQHLLSNAHQLYAMASELAALNANAESKALLQQSRVVVNDSSRIQALQALKALQALGIIAQPGSTPGGSTDSGDEDEDVAMSGTGAGNGTSSSTMTTARKRKDGIRGTPASSGSLLLLRGTDVCSKLVQILLDSLSPTAPLATTSHSMATALSSSASSSSSSSSASVSTSSSASAAPPLPPVPISLFATADVHSNALLRGLGGSSSEKYVDVPQILCTTPFMHSAVSSLSIQSRRILPPRSSSTNMDSGTRNSSRGSSGGHGSGGGERKATYELEFSGPLLPSVPEALAAVIQTASMSAAPTSSGSYAMGSTGSGKQPRVTVTVDAEMHAGARYVCEAVGRIMGER